MAAAPALSQAQRVVHLYRHSLRTILSWCIHRDLFYSELARTRDAFEAHRGVTDPAAVEGLLTRGEARLAEYAHPDQYTIPYAYGGSKYARSPPVPPEIHVAMDYDREEGTMPR